MSNLVGHAGLLDRRDRVSAADDGGGVVVARDRSCDLVGATGEGWHLEDSHWAIPDDGAGFVDLVFEERDGFGADIECHEFSREGAVAREDLGLCVGRELVGEDVVDGQEKADTHGLGLLQRGFGDVDLVDFDEGFAGGLALRVEERVSHAAADDDCVSFFEQVVDDLDLVGDLRAADDGDEGLVGFSESFAEVGELFFHQQTGRGLFHEVGDALRGGVGAGERCRRRR